MLVRMWSAPGVGVTLTLPLPLPLPLPVPLPLFGGIPRVVASSIPVSLSSSSPSRFSSLASSKRPTPLFHDDDYDEQLVIGDCLVFEDGIFEEDYHNPNPNPNPNSSPAQVEPHSLVPPDWNQVVEEINLTKKERRIIAQQTQFGHRILNKKKLNSVDVHEYLRFKNYKLSQLKPTRLDNPNPNPNIPPPPPPPPSSTRVEPKNPRWAVYGRTLDDVSSFFNAPTYQPPPDSDPDSDSHMPQLQGRHKLFTKEEKALMNARIPKLPAATSLNWLPLHTLTASGEFYLVNTLFKYQVDINAADQDGLTALHKAILCKKQAITNYLLRESANSFVRDKDGASLMHYAVQTASSLAIKTLVLHNVDINLADNDGWTPLHLAVQARRTDVVRLLLKKGADKTLKNQDGLTPLELCLHFGRDTKTYELIKLLKQLPGQGR